MRSRKELRRPDPKIFLCISASAADAAAANPKEIKTILANGLITFDIKGNPVFSNGPSNLPRYHPDCIILMTGFFIICYLLINGLKKIYEDLQLVY